MLHDVIYAWHDPGLWREQTISLKKNARMRDPEPVDLARNLLKLCPAVNSIGPEAGGGRLEAGGSLCSLLWWVPMAAAEPVASWKRLVQLSQRISYSDMRLRRCRACPEAELETNDERPHSV